MMATPRCTLTHAFLPKMLALPVTKSVKPAASAPNSITAYGKYGMHRTNLSYMCMNNWNFPAEYQDCLSAYYLLQWEGKYFGEKLREGTISHNDEEYIVVYKNTTYFAAKKAAQVRLSFRKPQPEFNLPGYVIVSVFAAALDDSSEVML